MHKCYNYTKIKKGEPNLEKLKNCLDKWGHYNECVKLLEKNPKWEAERAALRPLPATRFDGARYKEAKVNRYSMVQFETNRYSVPTIYVGEKVTVKATADEVKILYKGVMIASHPRIYGRYQEQITLDHYLELLLQKSRALDNTKVYKPQTLAPVYEQYRRSLNARSPRGNREFVRILLLHRDIYCKIETDKVAKKIPQFCNYEFPTIAKGH